jgi:hypothetical protein
MIPCYRRFVVAISLFVALLFVGATNSSAATITLRSGNVPPTALDPLITYYAEPSGACAVPFATPFSPSDFAAADAGPSAWSVPAFSVWAASLWCDPAAGWISTGPNSPSRSALYSVPFTVPVHDPCCIQSATIEFCWAADDILGDPVAYGGPNPLGVYLNGVPLPIAGGNYAAATNMIVDITGLLQCGGNRLYVYNRDLGCAVAGTIFSATINYSECVTPAGAHTWGSLKSIYR